MEPFPEGSSICIEDPWKRGTVNWDVHEFGPNWEGLVEGEMVFLGVVTRKAFGAIVDLENRQVVLEIRPELYESMHVGYEPNTMWRYLIPQEEKPQVVKGSLYDRLLADDEY